MNEPGILEWAFEFFFKFKYLFFSIILFLVFLSCLFFADNKRRKPMLVSALLSTPFAFASIYFVPEYWQPVRIFDFITGPEDLMFSFANGGLIWFFVSTHLPFKINCNFNTGVISKRFFGCTILGLLLSSSGSSMGLGVMASAILGMLCLGVVLLVLRKDLLPLAILGSSTFFVFYTLMTSLFFSMSPEFILEWNRNNLWGVSIFTIPLEEVLWAISFGAVWPLFVAYSLDISPVGKVVFLRERLD